MFELALDAKFGIYATFDFGWTKHHQNPDVLAYVRKTKQLGVIFQRFLSSKMDSPSKIIMKDGIESSGG